MALKRLCTICARGGSKGVPGKNIRPLNGKPLIVYSIEQAQASGLFAAIAVDSDSPEILDVARRSGVDLCIQRPADMATDTAAKLPVIRHAVMETERVLGLHFDTLCDLDATSPLRLPEDIVGAVQLVEEGEAFNVLTVTAAHRSPYFNMLETDSDGRVSLSKPLPATIVRRQDAPSCWDMNASIYVWRREPFLSSPYAIDENTRLFVMPRDRSLDIDDEVDFAIVEFLMRRRSDQA